MSLADILMRSTRGTTVPKSYLPLLQQALSEGAVRYSPAWDQLNQVRAQSAQTMRQSIAQANSAGQLNAALANQSIRNLNANTNPIIQKLTQYDGAPGVTGLVGKGLAYGQQGVSGMLAEAAANAPIRAMQQGLQARMLHGQDLQKIDAQRSSLTGQVGTFVTGRYGGLVGTDHANRAKVSAQKRQIASQLAQNDARLAVTTRGQDLTHADRQAAIDQRKQAAAGKGPGGIKPATPGQHGSLKDRISYGLRVAKTHKEQGDSRNLAGQILTDGVPAFTAPGGGKIPAIKALPQLSASVALDLAYDGHVSQRNVVELHKRGYSLNQLGLPTSVKPKVRLPFGSTAPLPTS